MTVADLKRQLAGFDDDMEVVINPDIPQGAYKTSPGNRPRRYSYYGDAVSQRRLRCNGKDAGIEKDVACVSLGFDAGLLLP